MSLHLDVSILSLWHTATEITMLMKQAERQPEFRSTQSTEAVLGKTLAQQRQRNYTGWVKCLDKGNSASYT